MSGGLSDHERIAQYKHALKLRQQAQAELRAEDWSPPPSLGSLREQLAAGVPKTEFLIDDLIPRGANVLLNAQYKKGKTTCALNVLRAVADEQPLFGSFDVHKDAKVAWWNAEVADATALRWLADLGVQHDQRVFPLHLRGQSFPLGADAVRDWAVKWLRKRKVKVWIVDPFGALFDGEENSNSDVRDWLRHLDEIKRRAKIDVLILVAHTGHSAQDDDAQVRARGAARLMDWPDVIWTFRAGNAHEPTRRYLAAQGRDVEVPEFTLDFDPDTRTLRRVQGALGRREDQLLMLARKAADVVAASPRPLTKNKLADAVGGKATLARQGIDLAVHEGWIVVEPGANKSQLHRAGSLDWRTTSRSSDP